MFRLLVRALTIFSAVVAAAPVSASSDGASASDFGTDLAAVISGPPGRYSFASYDSRHGLRNLAVGALAQDATGFLWVGTEDGLHRYNGRRFRRFGAEQGLPSSMVTAVNSARDGSIWVGTALGLARGRGDVFETVGQEAGLPAAPVQAIAEDAARSLWIASSEGLFRSADGRFVPARGWPGGAALAVWPEARGSVLAARGRELLRLSDRGLEASWTLAHEQAIGGVVVDGGGRLWVRAGPHLSVRDSDAAPFVEVTGELSMLADDTRLSLDRRGRLWVATIDGLVVCVGPGEPGGKDRMKWRSFGQRDGFPDRAARVILEDAEGSLWIAGNGLHRLLGRGVWQSYTTMSGLVSDHVWTIHRDPRGELWIGTAAGAMRGSPEGWTLAPGTRDRAVRAFAHTPDGQLLVGGSPFELGVLEPRTLAVEWIGKQAGLDGPHRILAIQVEGRESIWMATSGAGLLRSPWTRPWRFEPVELPGADGTERVSDVLLDSAGRLWVAGQQGLAVKVDGRWRRFTKADGLRDSQIGYLAMRRDGSICAAYREPLGVSCFQPPAAGERPRFEHLDSGRKLAQGRVYWLGEDGAGRFWMGTGMGIDVVLGEDVEHYGFGDGVPGEDSSARGFHADPEGDVWVATATGLGRFLGAAHRALPVPRTVLEEVRVAGRALPLDAPQPWEVERGQNALEVSFSGLTFVGEGQVNHEVRLVGVEDEWHPSEGRTARYAGLAPGDYRFEARARLGQGAWSEPARFDLSIIPAWWQRSWARVLMGLALLGLAGLALRWRVRALSKRNRELQANNDALARTNAALGEARERIAAAAAEISREGRRMLATASAQNAIATRQSAAIQETSRTVGLIADTSRDSAQRAGTVVGGARESESVSQYGKQAIEDAIAAMEQLSAQVAVTAERMRRMAEQSEKITDVIDTVRELSERSNVLAINASIEAARAGEHGRGFYVVSREMNQLAAQSKAAAAQVRAQLTEVQKETLVAVDEASEAQRRAQAAVQLAMTAGATISGLAGLIGEFSSSARKIAEDTRQQTQGVEETLVAVNQFAADMAETLNGARQIEQISANLSALSGGLAEQIERQER